MINTREGLSTADLAGRTSDSQTQEEPVLEERAEQVTPPAPAPTTTAATTSEESAAPLFDSGDAESYRGRWTEVQTGFVDDPRKAVEQADGLVAEVMKRLAEVFADERSTLEQQWSRGENVDTENLRVALRRYRSFFDRLLSV